MSISTTKTTTIYKYIGKEKLNHLDIICKTFHYHVLLFIFLMKKKSAQ
jgi:hypothetical protein